MLSILIPAYNERKTIANVIVAVSLVLPEVDKEVIIVDDGSKDGTTDYLKRNIGAETRLCRAIEILDDGELKLLTDDSAGPAQIRLRALHHAQNAGKGAGLATALKAATGDVIVIQDADLEYDPTDWVDMYKLIAVRKVADVVYGSRFYGKPHRALYFHHYMANRLISFLFNILYNQQLTDIETCYKMFSREVGQTLAITSNGFGVEVQLSAQIALARKWRIYEMGICYYGRTYAEGKKINWRDGVAALWYLLYFRF